MSWQEPAEFPVLFAVMAEKGSLMTASTARQSAGAILSPHHSRKYARAALSRLKWTLTTEKAGRFTIRLNLRDFLRHHFSPSQDLGKSP